MISCEKHNTSLVGLFYSFFHNIEGPKLAVQYPPNCISIDTFNGITDYVITKDQLCGRTVRVSIRDVDIVGFPMQISSRHYFRNAFNFNVCFVVKKGKSQGYEAMVKKTVLKLEYLEREKGFLQQPNILTIMSGILETIYTGLLEKNSCDLWLDPFTRLLLFPVVPVPKDQEKPHDFDVPFCCYSTQEIVRLLPDTVMYEEIIHAVDGIHCVYQLQSMLKMNELQLKVCLAFLHSVGAIRFIDIFDVCNIYVLEDFEALCDDSLLKQCLDYCRCHTPPHCSSKQASYESNESFPPLPSVELVDLRRLLSLFHCNLSLMQITQHGFYTRLKHAVDLRRLVVFCCIHHILRRVYVVPVFTSDPAGFYALFGSTLSTATTVEDTVGMSMDSQGRRGEEEESRQVAASLYHSLFSCFQYSLFHGRSKEVCECQVEKKVVRKMMEKHQCLESIALHCNSCIPAVMRCLESFGNVVFLKVCRVCWSSMVVRRWGSSEENT